jgi:hypothetical protein
MHEMVTTAGLEPSIVAGIEPQLGCELSAVIALDLIAGSKPVVLFCYLRPVHHFI